MQTHAYAQRIRLLPRLCQQVSLGLNARPQAVLGGGESGVKAVAGAFDHLPVGAFHGCPHELVVAGQDGLHRLRKLLPQPGAAFQVRKKESQRRRGQRRRVCFCHP